MKIGFEFSSSSKSAQSPFPYPVGARDLYHRFPWKDWIYWLETGRWKRLVLCKVNEILFHRGEQQQGYSFINDRSQHLLRPFPLGLVTLFAKLLRCFASGSTNERSFGSIGSSSSCVATRHRWRQLKLVYSWSPTAWRRHTSQLTLGFGFPLKMLGCLPYASPAHGVDLQGVCR